MMMPTSGAGGLSEAAIKRSLKRRTQKQKCPGEHA
jgi:hypothetical protein